MNKTIIKQIVIFIFILITIELCGEIVNENKAKLVAINYFEYVLGLKEINRNVIIDKITYNYSQNTLCYYTICFQNGGYINIAATDASIPVLSYSLSGSIIPIEQSPPAYLEWMESYKREIYHIIVNNLDNSSTSTKWEQIISKDFSFKIKTIGPLTSSKWGQSRTNDYACPGYNNYMPGNSECPCYKCPAGCVAIAMAQIIYYWRWPLDKGFYTYYDWCNINDELIKFGNNNFEYELNAVSKLIYDCAESVDMQYCSNGCTSGAYTKEVVDELIYTFAYHHDADYKRKWYYSSDTWKNFIKSDLDNGQPIIYRGQGIGAHSFICDGYQSIEGDEFHFNWGWYGSYSGIDDWFTIDNLNPGTSNFSEKQAAIFHIKPNPELYIDYCFVGLQLNNLYYAYYTNGGTNEPWEIVPTTMQVIWSATVPFPENWRTIPSGVTAEYKAHKSIFLQNGFHAENGSHFKAKIIPCLNCENKYNNNIEEIVISSNLYKDYSSDKVNTTSNKFLKNISFKVYPNPNNGILNIHLFRLACGIKNIEIFDFIGNSIYFKELHSDSSMKINISDHPKGIYFIKVQAGDQIYTEKVIYR